MESHHALRLVGFGRPADEVLLTDFFGSVAPVAAELTAAPQVCVRACASRARGVPVRAPAKGAAKPLLSAAGRLPAVKSPLLPPPPPPRTHPGSDRCAVVRHPHPPPSRGLPARRPSTAPQDGSYHGDTALVREYAGLLQRDHAETLDDVLLARAALGPDGGADGRGHGLLGAAPMLLLGQRQGTGAGTGPGRSRRRAAAAAASSSPSPLSSWPRWALLAAAAVGLLLPMAGHKRPPAGG